MKSKRSILGMLVLLFFLSPWTLQAQGQSAAEAQDLHAHLGQLLEEHEQIRSFADRVQSAESQARQALAQYYPSLDVDADGGREDVEKEYGENTVFNRFDAGITLSQLITDFGATTGAIRKAALQLAKAKTRLESVRQEIMLEGVLAYINLLRARERLKYAKRSERRIKDLTGIEETLVEKGAGLSSDVLQAKSQLAGSKALRVRSEGELERALNRFEAVFYYRPTPEKLESFTQVPSPEEHIPEKLTEAVEFAMESNPELETTRFDVSIADKDILINKSAFYPKLSLFAEARSKENDEGIEGYRNELRAGVRFRYNLFRGGGDLAAVQAAESTKSAAYNQLQNAGRLVEEQVRNSWNNLLTMRRNADLLVDQAAIVREFLDLAKRERKMGTRSLLDVLNGEVNYINALSSSVSAQKDTKIAAYTLLFAMGNLRLGLFSDLMNP